MIQRHRVRRWGCLLAASAITACGSTEPPTPSADVADDASDVATLEPDVDAPSLGPSWTAVPPVRADLLQQRLDQALADLGLTGAAIAVAFEDTQELWVGTAGYSNTDTEELWEPDRSFRIGSVTKTFTAAIVFQLMTEGRLSLDDSLETWVPGYYDDVGITVRHLLANTSGIASYNYVGSFDEGRPWTPTELVQWSVDHEPALRFEPGREWEYSNTNYVLLGLVIEAVTGHTYEEEVRARLTAPLGLDDTYVAGSGDDNPNIVRCYDLDGVDIAESADPSFGWAAGAIVSTPFDLVRWAVALYGGHVLSDESFALMVTPTMPADGSDPGYGLGAFVETDGAEQLYGHTGGIAAFLTYAYYYPPESVALVAMSNRWETQLRDFAGYGWAGALDLDYP